MARLNLNTEKKLRKIPILITKWNDGNMGWRAEIADNYENYKPIKPSDVNFEDLSFHFKHNVDTHEGDPMLFYRKKDAVACAKYVNETYLNGKGKIRFTRNKEIGTVRCTKCGGLVHGKLQYAGDNYCKGHTSDLAEFCKKIAKQSDCPPEFIEIVNNEFWNLI